MKAKSQKMYSAGNIFAIIEIILGAVSALVGGLFYLCNPYYVKGNTTVDPVTKEEILPKPLTDYGIWFLVIGLVIFALAITATILSKKAKKWPNPSKNMNIATAVFAGASLNVFSLLGAIYTIKAAEENPDQMDDKEHIGMKSQKIITNTISYIVLALISIVWIIPFVFIVLQSFRVESSAMSDYIMPKQFGLDNYIYLFSPECKFLIWYFNTFIIALAVAIIATAMQLMMAYTLSRFRFKLRKPLMNVMLILGMFPGFLTMIVLYQILKSMGLTSENSVGGLILVSVASSGMGYYVSKGFFDTVPKSLDEAARIDGATRLQIFYKVILPLAKPIVIYTILTAFMGPWGDFVFARVIAMGEPTGYNVAVGLWNWLSQDQIGLRYTSFCAGGVIVAIPVIVIFLFLQKYYVEGVTGGAVKG